jgi:hypothetical protein
MRGFLTKVTVVGFPVVTQIWGSCVGLCTTTNPAITHSLTNLQCKFGGERCSCRRKKGTYGGSISFGLGDVLMEASHSSALAIVSCSCIVGLSW